MAEVKTIVTTPFYEIKVKGTKLKDELAYLDSLKFNDPIDGSKSLEIVLSDPNYIFIGSDIYVEDTPVSATMGIPEIGYIETFDGYISAIDINFPDSGTPSLTINCIDGLHLFNSERKSRTWTNTTKVAVMEEVAKEHGFAFECTIQQSPEESIVQDDVTDLEFIEDLRSDDGSDYRLYLRDEKTLVYEKIDFKADNCGKLHYRELDFSLLSFSPQVNKETKETEVNDSDIVSETKQPTTATSSSNSDDSTTQGEPVEHNSNAGNVTFDFSSQTYSINK